MSFSIPIVLNSAIYNAQLQSTVEDYQQIGFRITKQSRDYLDMRIEEMDSIVSQLENEPVLNYLFATDSTYKSGHLTYKLWLTLNKMSLYQKSNNFFVDFGVFIENKNLIISSNSVYNNLSTEYGKLISYDGLDYQDFISMLSRFDRKTFMPVIKYRYLGSVKTETDVIIYKDSLPQTSSLRDGCVYFLIPVTNIDSCFGQLSSYHGSSVYIIDNNQELIYQWPDRNNAIAPVKEVVGTTGFKDVFIGNERMFIYSVYSSKSGLTFISMVPYSTILHRVLYIKQISLISAGILFILGISVSFLLARKNSKPILELIKLISPVFKRAGDNDNMVDFKQLHGSIASLVSDNETMSRMMEQQLHMLRDSFFSKLIRNEFLSDQETEAYLSHLKINIPKGPYIAVFLYLSRNQSNLSEPDLKEIQAIKYILKKKIEEVRFAFYAYENDFDKMIILFSRPCDVQSDSEWMEQIDESIGGLRRIITGETSFALAAGGGIPVQHLSEIGLAVSSARLALTYYSPNLPVLWHHSVSDELFYYYPSDMENRIVNFVCMGNRDMVRSLLNDLYEENFRKRHLSEYAFKQLIFCMLSSINHIVLNHTNLAKQTIKEIILIITSLEDLVTAQEFWEKLCGIYDILCEYFRNHLQSKRSVMIQGALDFIANNFSDAQMNIHSISDHIGINPEYFSRLFKEETGEYFSDYLEKCRSKRPRSYWTAERRWRLYPGK
jgi:hypothetical protein